ncbi:MAG: hypothetical protein NVS2B14_08170 [Chamaesiphon sp.]
MLGNHPQIPELLDYFEQDGQQYLVQEFIDGKNLEQELAESGAFKEVQIHQFLQDLLPVLQFVHEQQVIHRDIKPANIIRRSSDTQLILVDFGTAKFATSTALTGTAIGTAEYAAPEQIRGKATFGSDLYSLGVTCIYLLTQVSPFDLFDSTEDNWVWRDYLNSPLSEALAQILDKLLQNAVRRRYQSVAAVLKDLSAVPTRVADASLSNTFQQDTDFGMCCRNVKKQAASVPVMAATLFDPQTQAWYRLGNLFEDSESVWALVPFLRP